MGGGQKTWSTKDACYAAPLQRLVLRLSCLTMTIVNKREPTPFELVVIQIVLKWMKRGSEFAKDGDVDIAKGVAFVTDEIFTKAQMPQVLQELDPTAFPDQFWSFLREDLSKLAS